MTKERKNIKVVSKFTESQKENNISNHNVKFIFPPHNEFSSDETISNNSIKKDITNIIETLGNNMKQEPERHNSNEDTITYDSSLHSENDLIHNKTATEFADKIKPDNCKKQTHKAREQNVQCNKEEYSSCNKEDNTVTESSDLISIPQELLKDENRYFPPPICKFCQEQLYPTSYLNKSCKLPFQCDNNKNCTCYFHNKIQRPLSQFCHVNAPAPEFNFTDPIYKYKHCRSALRRDVDNDYNWNQSRYHNSHEYLRARNYRKSYKMEGKYSHLKQNPNGIIGNIVHNVGQWYNNLKQGGEGDREELFCHACPERQFYAESLKLYRAKIEKAEDSDPERITFNRVTGIPKYDFFSPKVHHPSCHYVKHHNLNIPSNSYFDNKDLSNGVPFMQTRPPFNEPVEDEIGGIYKPSPVQPERIDVYYFDHGNSGYYRTTDRPPPLCTEILVERTDEYATKFWAEIFGACHIIIAFVTTFILQLFRFCLYSMVRPLLVGFIQLSSDYFFKPLLTIAFNGFIQPIFILMYNIATSLRDLCEPIAKAFGFFIQEIALLLKAIRFVDVNTTNKNGPFCYPHQPA